VAQRAVYRRGATTTPDELCSGGVDIKQGRYPLKGLRLSREDVEWLVTAEEQRGAQESTGVGSRKPPGLDVRGADMLAVCVACEAIIGLTIEINFIATFTQRYYGK